MLRCHYCDGVLLAPESNQQILIRHLIRCELETSFKDIAISDRGYPDGVIMFEVETPVRSWKLHINSMKAYLTYEGSPTITDFPSYYAAIQRLKNEITIEVKSGE